MSINTANLIATKAGQLALAEVAEQNQTRSEESKAILVFPYIAISPLKPEEVEGIESTTEAEIKKNPCWANVDICQVQTLADGVDGTKKDFTIGCLFDVKHDITDARTVILYAQTKGMTSTSNNKYVPFAYTRLLDSTGVYKEEGITIAQSRYGRSRHRFYFNYIIGDDIGASDVINVDENYYPYSDGYLSKTAFENGLSRYEKAVKDMQEDYQKSIDELKQWTQIYSRGVYCYETLDDAEKNAVKGQRIEIAKELFGTTQIDNLDIFNVDNFEFETPLITPPTAVNKSGASAASDILSAYAAYVGEAKFFGRLSINEDGKETTRLVPIKMKYVMWQATLLPPSERSQYRVGYKKLRVVLEHDGIMHGYELDAGRFFAPVPPTIGKCEILNTSVINRIVTQVMIEELAEQSDSQGNINEVHALLRLMMLSRSYSTKIQEWSSYSSTYDRRETDYIRWLDDYMQGGNIWQYQPNSPYGLCVPYAVDEGAEQEDGTISYSIMLPNSFEPADYTREEHRLRDDSQNGRLFMFDDSLYIKSNNQVESVWDNRLGEVLHGEYDKPLSHGIQFSIEDFNGVADGSSIARHQILSVNVLYNAVCVVSPNTEFSTTTLQPITDLKISVYSKLGLFNFYLDVSEENVTEVQVNNLTVIQGTYGQTLIVSLMLTKYLPNDNRKWQCDNRVYKVESQRASDITGLPSQQVPLHWVAVQDCNGKINFIQDTGL